MRDLNFKPKWFKTLSLTGLCLLQTSCFSLGVKELPKPPKTVKWVPCDAPKAESLKKNQDSVVFEMRYKGQDQPLGTAQAPWGNWTRYVFPYTDKTTLFEVTIENKGDFPVRFPMEQIQLSSGEQTFSPLDLDFFKAQWPTSAIQTEEELTDQSQAIGHVIRTIYQPRLIFPSQKLTGILAFRSHDLAPPKSTLFIVDTPFCWQPSS